MGNMRWGMGSSVAIEAGSSKKETVQKLLDRCRQGDVSAFEKLVLMYQQQVFALSMQLTGHPDDAQDLAQETFIRAYHYLSQFRGDADFGTYLHRITVNLWLNKRKKAQREEAVSLDQPVATEDGEMTREVADTAFDPLQSIEQSEFRQVVWQALQELAEEHRVIIVLRDIHGYSYEEIAQILNLNSGTVKSRLNRARKALREKLIKAGVWA